MIFNNKKHGMKFIKWERYFVGYIKDKLMILNNITICESTFNTNTNLFESKIYQLIKNYPKK